MSLSIIEGTWEEVKLHEAELTGRRVKVTIKADESSARQGITKTRLRRISAMGKYAGILSTEDYFRHKREEIDSEDRQR